MKWSSHNNNTSSMPKTAVSTLTIKNTIEDTEFIILAGNKFTLVCNDPKDANEVKLAPTTKETAQNLAKAISLSEIDAIRPFYIDAKGAEVIITWRVPNNAPIPLDTTNSPNIEITTEYRSTSKDDVKEIIGDV